MPCKLASAKFLSFKLLSSTLLNPFCRSSSALPISEASIRLYVLCGVPYDISKYHFTFESRYRVPRSLCEEDVCDEVRRSPRDLTDAISIMKAIFCQSGAIHIL